MHIFFKMSFLVISIFPLPASNSRASPGNPENWCCYGGFLDEGPVFRIGKIKGKAADKIQFLNDDNLCSDQRYKKCYKKS
jgi:hypothetical protein